MSRSVRPGSPTRGGVELWLVGAALFGLAGWFVLDSGPSELPEAPSPAVAAADLATTPRRTPLGNPPTIRVGPYDQTCQDCHFVFESSGQHLEQRFKHEEIVLHHGMNDHCHNCHHLEDRNLLVLQAGRTSTYDRSELLCAQCHGTTFRDWSTGMHGKTMGSWDPLDPRQRRLTCVACHDPHSPAFPGIAPLPGPNTLRMGDQDLPPHHFESPLMKWHNPSADGEPRGDH